MWDPLWENTVTHPFVIELGEGSLPQEKFNLPKITTGG